MANAALADPEALRRVGDLSRPVVLAKDLVLPVGDAYGELLPEDGLRRGSTVSIVGGVGATSLALGLISEASRSGSWIAIVAMPWLGLLAAEEYGIDLARVAIIDEPGNQWATVVAALVGAFDVVLTGTPHRVKSAEGRRLSARMRERGTVLVHVEGADSSRRPSSISGDITLTTRRCEWGGLQDGHGRLVSRRIEVLLGGRGAAGRGGAKWLTLPAPDGAVRSTAPEHTSPEHTAVVAPDRLIGSADDVEERLRHLRIVPESTVHESTVHESTVHESTVHESTVHESTVHESTVHESTVHESTVPEAG